jgi:hypothetical protein
MNLTASEARWFAWAIAFAVLCGIVLGLATAEWLVVPR